MRYTASPGHPNTGAVGSNGAVRSLDRVLNFVKALPAALGRGLAAAVICLPLAAFSFEALFAPRAELWERWTVSDESNQAVIDHGAWDGFLKRYVTDGPDGVALLRYGAVTPADRDQLDAYVDWLAATPISTFSKGEQYAYWINFYNALTVKVILDHLPVDSILDVDISPGLFADGPWDKKLVQVEGEEVSLNDIEHRILRPIWQDPRIHYGVNCASIGCPNLQGQAYTAANTDDLLTAGAKAYVNSPRGAKVADGQLTVSSIYVWFQEDFGGNDRGVIDHLLAYAEPPLAAQLKDIKAISSHAYDWDLNAAGGGTSPESL